MSRQVAVREVEEHRLPEWTRLLADSPEGSIYADPGYLDVLCRATGGRFRLLGAYSGDQLVGGIALYEERRPYGWRTDNRLLLYYNGVVLADYATKYASDRTGRRLGALTAIVARLGELPQARLRLHCRGQIDARPFKAHGWGVTPTYTYVVQIGDLDAAWGRVDQNLRRLVGRAGSAGLTLTDDDDFDGFYRLHLQVHARKEAPLYLPEPAFRDLVGRLRALGLCRLFHARLPSGQSVAAQLVLTGPFGVSHTVCAGADAAHLASGSTPFLRWHAFRRLAELGYRANDLTDASLNTVTRFKSQLGGDLTMNLMMSRPDRVPVERCDRALRLYYAWRSRMAAAYHAVRGSRTARD
jgi:hypothetical protein